MLTGANKPDKFYAEIRSALFSYVADKLNISPHGMTGDNLMDILQRSGADEELRQKVSVLLRKADFAQYSSSTVSKEDILQSLNDAEEIMVRLEGIRLA